MTRCATSYMSWKPGLIPLSVFIEFESLVDHQPRTLPLWRYRNCVPGGTRQGLSIIHKVFTNENNTVQRVREGRRTNGRSRIILLPYHMTFPVPFPLEGFWVCGGQESLESWSVGGSLLWCTTLSLEKG